MKQKEDATRKEVEFSPGITVIHHLCIATTGPIYVRITDGMATYTRELLDGRVFADFSADGKLLGIEIL